MIEATRLRRDSASPGLVVPYFRPSFTESEIDEVAECLRSGWITTGPRVAKFEQQFAEFLGAKYAVAVNSCTAALHLAVDALELRSNQAVLVPTMTFAASAEVIRYQGAIPVLVDCDPVSLQMDLRDAERKALEAESGQLTGQPLKVVGMIPVHVGGLMGDWEALHAFAERRELWVVEDAAHAFPSAFRSDSNSPWRWCGQNTADVTCFSFYANKTMTTGEGGMAVTEDRELADRMRRMSLHGLSNDAWKRHVGNNSWDYQIIAPGYKYNCTDIAASIGIHQLARAESMRKQREAIAEGYLQALSGLDAVETPVHPENRIHSWHLFPIRLQLNAISVDRNTFMDQLRQRGVGVSVHWRPLHLHPYYAATFGWTPEQLRNASVVWERLISLPLFPSMTTEEQDHVVSMVRDLCEQFATPGFSRTTKPR